MRPSRSTITDLVIRTTKGEHPSSSSQLASRQWTYHLAWEGQRHLSKPSTSGDSSHKKWAVSSIGLPLWQNLKGQPRLLLSWYPSQRLLSISTLDSFCSPRTRISGRRVRLATWSSKASASTRLSRLSGRPRCSRKNEKIQARIDPAERPLRKEWSKANLSL